MADEIDPRWWTANYCIAYTLYSLLWSFRFEGGRHIPTTGPVLVLANHQSFLDPHAVGVASSRPLHSLARKSLFKNPLLARYMTGIGAVPVETDGVAKEGLKTVIGLLEQGRAVLVFPEGERTHKGDVQPLRPGVHLLIKRAPVPVVPVGIAGAFDAFPRTRKAPRLSPIFLPTTGADVATSVGPALDGRELVKLSREQLLQTLHDAIVAAKNRAERLRREIRR
jgi:1-acyl-sn-glycerol-3-phosphate acyltransferase